MQKSSPLLTVSAAVYFVAAVGLLFAPDEILGFAGALPSRLDAALLQVLGSALLGFAMLNWMQRHAVIGGIYGRPIVAANFAHAGSAAFLLAHVALRGERAPALLAALGIYGVLAIAFGARFYGRSPTAS